MQLWVKGRAADQMLISASWVLPNLTFIAFTASKITVLRCLYFGERDLVWGSRSYENYC